MGNYTASMEDRGKAKFKLSDKRVNSVNDLVPAICPETTGSCQSSAGSKLFQARRQAQAELLVS